MAQTQYFFFSKKRRRRKCLKTSYIYKNISTNFFFLFAFLKQKLKGRMLIPYVHKLITCSKTFNLAEVSIIHPICLVLLVSVRSMFGSSHSVLCYKFLPRNVNYVKNLNRALCALKEEQVIKMFGPHKYNYEN